VEPLNTGHSQLPKKQYTTWPLMEVTLYRHITIQIRVKARSQAVLISIIIIINIVYQTNWYYSNYQFIAQSLNPATRFTMSIITKLCVWH